MAVPITNGTGASSVAAEAVSGLQYQQIQVYGKGGSSVLSIDPAGAMKVSVVGTLVASVSGTVGASILGAVPVVGSIAGTYPEDAPHTSGDLGVFIMGVRNDTIASVASANGDYTPVTTDASGRIIYKPFAGDNATLIEVVGSVVSTSVTLVQASAVGKRNYVTDVMIANTGASATLVTIQDGSTSVLGYTIAPAGGGSNIPGINIPLRTAPSQDLAIKATTASSVLYYTIRGYQA